MDDPMELGPLLLHILYMVPTQGAWIALYFWPVYYLVWLADNGWLEDFLYLDAIYNWSWEFFMFQAFALQLILTIASLSTYIDVKNFFEKGYKDAVKGESRYYFLL